MRQLHLVLGVLTAALAASAVFFVMLVVTGAPLTAAVLPAIAIRTAGTFALAMGFVCQPLQLTLAGLGRLNVWSAALCGIGSAFALGLILGGSAMLADWLAFVLVGATGGLVFLPFALRNERLKAGAEQR